MSYDSPLPETGPLAFLTGGGEMGERTRSFDWTKTPVGSLARWPQSLKTLVRTMLDSRYAMWLGWGPDFTFFYNDAYAKMTLGPKHPWALGKSAREVWSEIWTDIGPRAESVIRTGQATWDEGLLLFLERQGFPEETYHTFSYSPVPNDTGGVGGMLCVVTEDTERTIGERRLRTLRELAARTNDVAKSVEEACQTATRSLIGNPHDLPFVVLYLLSDDARRARIVGQTGLGPDSPICPAQIDLAESLWPFRQVVESGSAIVVDDLQERFGPLPSGAWPEPASRAIVLPMAKPGQARPTGFVVSGISPRLVFNDGYRGFLDLIASHLAIAIANAQAYEEERQRAEKLAELDRWSDDLSADLSPLPNDLPAPGSPPRISADRPRVLVADHNIELRRYVRRLLTDRKQIEEDIRESRSRLESTLAASEIGTWEFDVVKDTVWADPNLARMFGVTPAQAAGGPLSVYLKAIHPDDHGRVNETISQAMATGDTFESEYRLVDQNGDIRWVVARGRIERDGTGRAIRLPGVVIDITARKRAEEESARFAIEAEYERRRFSAVLTNTADFIYTFDLEGRFTFVNSALLSLWQKDLEEALGKNFFDLGYPPELAERLQRQILEVIESQRPIRDETPYSSAVGERQYEYIFVPVFGKSGAVESVAGSTRDITDRKRVEEALRKSEERLRDADRRKDEFLAILAHELRNPLAPIRNGLQIMRLGKGDSEAIEQVRTMMERQLSQMVHLVDDLLDLSRISRGKIELRKERVELSRIVQQAVETSRPLLEANFHELTITVPPGPIYVDADVTRMAQVFSNLLNNAAKYTERGGRVQLAVQRRDGEVVVSIKDNGVGIPAHMLPRVFEMFTQVDRNLERSQGGLGIGLSIVKRLVEMHGGSVGVESDGPGMGSEFVVRLPVVLSVAQSIGGESVAASPSSRRRILVVDDNADAAMSLAMMLKLMGNETKTAHDGLEALQVAGAFRPDLILLDIGMPRLNGYETAKRIREQPWGKNVLLVALTGWGQEEDRRKSDEAGFDSHMVKPVEPAALEKLLRTRQADTA